MAYQLKYYHNFTQLNKFTTETWRIQIFEEGYIGSSTLVDIAANTIKVSRGGDMFEVVQGSKMTFELTNTSEQLFQEFRYAAYGQYLVKLIKDPLGVPVTKFEGYNQSEIYTETFNQPPYSSRLEFTCGLNHLKYVRFDNSGVFYTGKKSLIEVIRLCLNKLANPLSIRESIDLFENSITYSTTNSMFNQIYVDVSVYKEIKDVGTSTQEQAMFCHDVLEAVLKPFFANIFHFEGLWHIISIYRYQRGTIDYRQFLPRVGAESTITIDSTLSSATNVKTVTGSQNPLTSSTLILNATTAEASMLEPLNRIKITYNQNTIDLNNGNIIKNGDFKNYTKVLSGSTYIYTILHWTVNGDNPNSYTSLIFDNVTNLAAKIWFRFKQPAQIIATAFSGTYYITQTKTFLNVATTDKLQLSFETRAKVTFNCSNTNNLTNVVNFMSKDLYLRYAIKIQVGTYYLTGDQTAGFSWTLTNSYAVFDVKNFMNKYGSGTISQTYLHTINEVLPLLPETGEKTFIITITRPYSNLELYDTANSFVTMNWDFIEQTNFRLDYIVDNSPIVTETVVYAEIDEDEYVEEIEVIHGDGANTITLNSFRLSTGTITDLWKFQGGVTELPVLQWLAAMINRQRGGFIRVVNGNLIGEISPYNTIYWDYEGYGSTNFIQDYTWNVETNDYDVTLVEIDSFLTSQTFNTLNNNNGLANFVINQPITQTITNPNTSNQLVINTSLSVSFSQTQLNNFL